MEVVDDTTYVVDVQPSSSHGHQDYYEPRPLDVDVAAGLTTCGGVDEINILNPVAAAHRNQRKVNGEVEVLEKDNVPDAIHASISTDHKSYMHVDKQSDVHSRPKKSKCAYKRKFELSPPAEEFERPISGDTRCKSLKKRYHSKSVNEISSFSGQESSGKAIPKTKKISKQCVDSQQLVVAHKTVSEDIGPSSPLTEYAQYLGLQPTVKFKCYRCGESGFPSMHKLQEHQNSCLKSFKMQPFSKTPHSLPVDTSPSTNFRITRKVYLCSACGTYYENWNLFLHMREVHNRHICLHCLGMFSQADKLRLHLVSKHGVIEDVIPNLEVFFTEYKGGCFLMCCSCEQMFTERDQFFDHPCREIASVNLDRACSLCGLRGAHFPSCRRAFTDGNSFSSSQVATSRPVTFPSAPESLQSTQLAIQESSLSVSKFFIPVERVFHGGTVPLDQKMSLTHEVTVEENREKRDFSDFDDDYDISDAASYCHVNIHETPEKQKPASSKAKASTKGKYVSSKKTDNEHALLSLSSRGVHVVDSEKSVGSMPVSNDQCSEKHSCTVISGKKLERETKVTPRNSRTNSKNSKSASRTSRTSRSSKSTQSSSVATSHGPVTRSKSPFSSSQNLEHELDNLMRSRSPGKRMNSPVPQVEDSCPGLKGSPRGDSNSVANIRSSDMQENSPISRVMVTSSDKFPGLELENPAVISRNNSVVREKGKSPKGSNSPLRSSNSPVVRPESPLLNVKSPRRRSKTPTRTKSPVQRSRNNVTSKSPIGRNRSPTTGSKAPLQYKTPVQRSRSPVTQSKSSAVSGKSPSRSKSPTRTRSPVGKAKTSKTRSKSPAIRTQSPTTISKSLMRERAVVRSKSPVVKGKIPMTPKMKTPIRKMKSPSTRSKSPTVRGKSPTQVKAHTQKSKSPVTTSRSPLLKDNPMRSKTPTHMKIPVEELSTLIAEDTNVIVRSKNSTVRDRNPPSSDSPVAKLKNLGNVDKSTEENSGSSTVRSKTPTMKHLNLRSRSKSPAISRPKTPVSTNKNPSTRPKTPPVSSKSSSVINSKSPTMRSETVGKQKLPRGRSKTPTKKMESPTPRSKTPEERDETADTKPYSPTGRSETPAHNSSMAGTGDRRPISPVVLPESPAVKSESSRIGLDSPRASYNSPGGRCDTPVFKSESPHTQSPSSHSGSRSPQDRLESIGVGSASPGGMTRSPVKTADHEPSDACEEENEHPVKPEEHVDDNAENMNELSMCIPASLSNEVSNELQPGDTSKNGGVSDFSADDCIPIRKTSVTEHDVSEDVASNGCMKASSATDGDSESESSESAGESHDSDASSSSSDASSEENDQQEKKLEETREKSVPSEEEDVENCISDKTSLVDETRSDESNVGHQQQCVVGPQNDMATHNQTVENNHVQHEKPTSDSELQDSGHVADDVKSEPASHDDSDPSDNIQIAGDDVPILELTLEENVDVMSVQTLVKECVKISCGTCVYCNHAKRIAVNGKQLVLHLLAEHRFEPVVCSDSGELTAVEGFVDRLRAALSILQDLYFNTDTYDSSDKSLTKPYDRTYECFHCNFVTTLHKELYVHNRKMHQKTILLCIMCKSNFYSYSELLCHLCPGIYVPDSNINFRCCLCVVDGLPSAFRLMVHLRKRHHACDVCLETTGDQQKLSNHVWKHKLHHLCYRCGIAYRNKPDITKHLFWKHGTESVLCKKCLQKKWPHVYHFCIPPTAFVCEECNASFSRAVALKVHKRLHAGDVPYSCDDCEECFISRKLLAKHQEKHRQAFLKKVDESQDGDKSICNLELEQEEDMKKDCDSINVQTPERENLECRDIKENITITNVDTSITPAGLAKTVDLKTDVCASKSLSGETASQSGERPADSRKGKVVDVYDLPPLNLSSDSDDSDGEVTKPILCNKDKCDNTSEQLNTQQNMNLNEPENTLEENSQADDEMGSVQVVDGIWDNFKTYKANLEKREIMQAECTENSSAKQASSTGISHNEGYIVDVNVIHLDHDYSSITINSLEIPKHDENQTLQSDMHNENDTSFVLKKERLDDDHNYCFNTSPQNEEKDREPVSTPASMTTSSPSKKKQKSPKKKQKHSGSSSSSGDSSSSDSSSCSCGTNCSCSSSSSSSSGSSSSPSSDSDSSSSEGRRRQAARRERRKERSKKKLGCSSPKTDNHLPSSLVTQTSPLMPPPQPEVPAQSLPPPESGATGVAQADSSVITAAVEQEDAELPIQESDLDTDETETDEDFYDKYPQKQANRLLAEKRNQLLLLAAVAPVNNGTVTQPVQSTLPETKEPVVKKKVKSKKHKKSHQQHNSSDKRVENKLKLNIPAVYYNNPSFSITNPIRSSSPLANIVNSSNLGLTSQLSRVPQEPFSANNPEPSASSVTYHSTGSGSETDSKRLSKRKRVPKKFYGDSSDDETDHPPQPYKWRKVVSGSSNSPQSTVQTVATSGGFPFKSTGIKSADSLRVPALAEQDKSEDEDVYDESESEKETKRSSSDSSNSDSDGEKEQDEPSDGDSDIETASAAQAVTMPSCSDSGQQKSENLYCYCQCPYDEVSEMIACDGKDCTIEWFHFECVGIMVPPKGKWFCPDCRKKSAGRSDYLVNS